MTRSGSNPVPRCILPAPLTAKARSKIRPSGGGGMVPLWFAQAAFNKGSQCASWLKKASRRPGRGQIPTVCLPTVIKHGEHVWSNAEFGIAVNHSESYFAGGVTYFH